MPNDFQQAMAMRLKEIATLAKDAKLQVQREEFEGCTLYENLLSLKGLVDDAITAYADDVPAVDRSAIQRMVEVDRNA